MIDKILEFSLRQRIFVVLGTLGLVAVGCWSAAHLPIDAVPDITNVQVQVNTAVTSLAPEEVEKLVTYPIEIEMGGIQGLEEVRSLSKFGLSQVTLIFQEGTDLYRARQLVSERLQNLGDLPPGVSPKLAPITTGLGEIYHYAVRYQADAKETPAAAYERLLQLKLAQDYLVKPALRSVPGVTEVNTSGGYEKQIVVMPDPRKLASVGMTMNELAALVAENTQNAGGGVVEKGGESITVRSVGRVQSAGEIADIPLKFRAGPMAMTVGDVAEVAIGSGVRTGSATLDGEEAVLGSALMLIGENSRLVSQRVDAKIREVGAKLPPGIEVAKLYDRTDLVNRTISTVERNLFEGAVLVVAVLIGMLGNWRAALIVALAIPLSLLFAITGMVRFGVSGNLMSLGAVDFGLIVDGAVFMAENIVRLLAHRQHQLGRLLTKEERLHIILAACKQVGTPTVIGVAIITIVYIPLLTLTGTEGKMFVPMAMTVIFALIGGLLLALTLVPAFGSFFLTGKITEKDNRLIGWAKRAHAPVLDKALRWRWPLVGTTLAIFVLSVWVFTRLGAVFVPRLDEGSIALQMVRTTSIGLSASLDMEKATEKRILEKFPEVTHIFSRVGTSEVATDPMGVNTGDSYVMLKPEDQWRKVDGHRLTKDGLIEAISKEVNQNFPGQAYLFSQPIELRFNELLSGSRADIAIKVFGDDYDVLEKVSGQIREIVEKIPGAEDVEFDAVGKAPVFEVSMNRDAMKRYNVHADEVNKLIGTAFAGEEAGVIVDGNRRYPIVVRLPEAERQKFDAVAQMPVRTQDGGLVGLGQIARTGMTESVNTITREASQRRMAIVINLRGRDVESFVNEARRKIKEQVQVPEGYFVEFGGAFQNLQAAKARLAVVVPTALLLIFLIIFLSFRSLRQAAIIYTGIPLAASGGIFALWATGLPFSVSAGVGFIALSGVAVLNGVVLLSFFNQLREEGRSIRDAVQEGSLTRLRPVLMTSLVAGLGFVPMALAHGAGAEVQRPLATVVIGGIVMATFLTLVLLPTLYAWVEEASQRIVRREKEAVPPEG
ncbi:MAG: CusA/CzcA family heavy metal efflux RND transporter [Verrucomicrobium sp.]|nr:CusA/CzcA family heavy metal efflux RND transporter [Verrucomicrobium sp.]